MARGPLVSLYIYIENFKNLHVRKHWTDFYITRQSSTKIVQAVMICQKNIAARGQGLFSVYISIENFKNLLVRNHWTDFINTWQKSFLLTLNQDCSSYHDLSKKHCRRVVDGEGGLISLYIYIEKFKNLLVRNQWTNFNITWQECCFGDPLPRLFKPS